MHLKTGKAAKDTMAAPAAAQKRANEIYMCQKRPAAAPAAVFEAHGVKRCHMVERRRRRMRRRNLKA